MHPVFYRRTFERHLHHLAISDFYARELDADDHAFLEKVKIRGIANGELPGYDAVSLEELDFGQSPYSIAPDVERKAGPVPLRTPESPEQREHRLLRSSAWRARRAISKIEKELVDAELERERLEWEKTNATRKLREAITDAEWNAAAPKIRYGKIENRHSVPQWKLDDRGELNETDQKIAIKRRREAREARKKVKNEERRRREAEERRAAACRESEARAARAARAAEEQEHRRAMLEQAWREAQEARELATRDAAILVERERRRVPTDVLKRAIERLVRSTLPRACTREELIRALGCSDAILNICINEMIRDGKLVEAASSKG